MTPAEEDSRLPIEIFITSEEFTTLSLSDSYSSFDDSTIISFDGDPLFETDRAVSSEMHFEVLDSKWEDTDEMLSHERLDIDSGGSPQLSSLELPCEDKASTSEARAQNSGLRLPRRRGSLVMRAVMLQEDIARFERVVSPALPTVPYRRGSLATNFQILENISIKRENDNSVEKISTKFMPVRPIRRGSVIMNVVTSGDAYTPQAPFRRGSIVSLRVRKSEKMLPDTGPLQRTISDSTVPPRHPFRKASMDLRSSSTSIIEGSSDQEESLINASYRSLQRQGSFGFRAIPTDKVKPTPSEYSLLGGGEKAGAATSSNPVLTKITAFHLLGYDAPGCRPAGKFESPRHPSRQKTMDMVSPPS